VRDNGREERRKEGRKVPKHHNFDGFENKGTHLAINILYM
jgi:hypothetical protein